MHELHLDGQTPSAEQLATLALMPYGHFTSMQIRAGAVQGLHLHLQRLDRANRLLFGAGLPGEDVRALLRQALGGRDLACSARITVFSPELNLQHPGGRLQTSVLISLRSPGGAAAPPMKLQVQPYQRELPAIKHIATLGLMYARRLAQASHCDDALFVNPAGEISEASVWNIGFVDGDRIVWPSAPALPGVAMEMLKQGLRQAGVAQSDEPVHRDQLGRYRAAFLCNARVAVQPVTRIDHHRYEDDAALWQKLREAHASQPWQSI